MKTFDDFYFEITENEKKIVDLLRELVLSISPKFREKIAYGVPYYFIHSRICYIWPATIKPGPKSGVQFGLCQGQKLSNIQGILELAGRKEIATIAFQSPKEINPIIIREITNEAILIDEEMEKYRKMRLIMHS